MPLPPGGTVAPDVFAPGDLGALLADTGSKSWGDASFGGKAEEWVYLDTVTGKLDFVYQVSLTATSAGQVVEGVKGFNFTGFATDVGYIDPGSGVIPASVHRSPGGDTVTFNFGGITVGNTSRLLVIKTDATAFTGGNIGVVDGTQSNVPGFAPGPAPNTLVLAGAAFAGLAGVVVWRRRRATPVLA